jgi:uncharacterized protein YjbI with pentapeptide repeats
MWESLVNLLSGSATPWVIGVLSTLITGWWALKKLRYEKRLEKFKDTNANLFKDRKQEVLAAIATLSIFKRDPEFEKNTIDVLLSRLYTELDYDIINSIISTLIQDSNRDDLLYIADGLQDINRNFFVQDFPMNQRVSDLNEAIKRLEPDIKTEAPSAETPGNEPSSKNTETEIYLYNKNEVIKQYNEDFLDLFTLQKYKLVWHKQVTADAYAMFLRKAYLAKKGGNITMRLFQNDFNYVYMAEVTTTNTRIERSAFGRATFAEVHFENIYAFKSSFSGAQILQSSFKNGTMKNISFSQVKFEEVLFENIDFENCSFDTSDFKACSFLNCKGLKQEHFKDAIQLDESNVFPSGINIESNDQYLARMNQGSANAQTNKVEGVSESQKV